MKNIHLKRMVSRKNFIYVLLIGVFVLLIPDMLKGIDLTDMAYMLARYKYVFDQEIPINDFSIIFLSSPHFTSSNIDSLPTVSILPDKHRYFT